MREELCSILIADLIVVTEGSGAWIQTLNASIAIFRTPFPGNEEI
jgi:hypothetical protein